MEQPQPGQRSQPIPLGFESHLCQPAARPRSALSAQCEAALMCLLWDVVYGPLGLCGNLFSTPPQHPGVSSPFTLECEHDQQLPHYSTALGALHKSGTVLDALHMWSISCLQKKKKKPKKSGLLLPFLQVGD